MTDADTATIAEAPKRRKRSRLARAICLAVLAAVLLAVWLAWPRVSPLLARSTPLPYAFGSQYHWRSETELVVLEPAATAKGFTTGRAEIVDVRTGSRTVAARFRMPGGAWARWDFGSVSPDGRWALWLGWAWAGGPMRQPCRIGAVSLVGGPHVTWPAQDWMIGAAWLHDSRSLLLGTLTQQPRAVLQSLPVGGRPAPPLRLGSQAGGHGQSGVFGVLPSGRALLWVGGTGFQEIDLRTGAVTDVDLSAAVPLLERVEQCEPSPTCDRLAWVTVRDTVPLAGWLAGAGARLGLRYRRTSIRTLWVTDIRGRRRRLIGTCTGEGGGPGGSPIVTVRWLPSGKRLSFVHGRTLYTVPAD